MTFCEIAVSPAPPTNLSSTFTKLSLIQDLGVVLLVAGIVGAIFHWRKWPKVIGYILAGILLGIPWCQNHLLSSPVNINVLGNLGIVFLMFNLGLDLQFRKLKKIAPITFSSAFFDMAIMFGLGIGLGHFLFHWPWIPSIFLGAVLCDSSTTLLAKSLEEMGCTRKHFATLIFGITITEDILTIGVLAILTSLAVTGAFQAASLFHQLGYLILFLSLVLFIGFMGLPFLQRTMRKKVNDEEVLLLIILGGCLLLSLFTENLKFSLALGAFLVGAIVTESEGLLRIRNNTIALRNVFSAVFFATIGMMVNFTMFWANIHWILLISLVVLLGKTFTNAIATFFLGQPPKDAMTIGVGLAQLGDFSYLVAMLGMTLFQGEAPYPQMYQIAVGVSILTTLINPLLLKNTPRFCQSLSSHSPQDVLKTLGHLTNFIQHSHEKITEKINTHTGKEFKKILTYIIFDFVLCFDIFTVGHLLMDKWPVLPLEYPINFQNITIHPNNYFYLVFTLIFVGPFIYAVNQNGQKLGTIIAYAKSQKGEKDFKKIKHTISTIILGFNICLNAGLLFRYFLDELSILEITIRLALTVLILSILFLLERKLKFKKDEEDIKAGEIDDDLKIGWLRKVKSKMYSTIEDVLQEEKQDMIISYGIDNPDEEINRYRITVPANSYVIGRKLKELNFRNITGASILTITHMDGIKINFPAGYDTLKSGDELMISATKEQFMKLKVLLNSSTPPDNENEVSLYQQNLFEKIKNYTQRIILDKETFSQGITLKELNLRYETGASVVAIQREEGENIFNPGADDYLLPGDQIMLKGTKEQLEKAEAFLQAAAKPAPKQ